MGADADSVRTLGGLLERRAATYGDRTIFRFSGETCSYAALDARANAIANELYTNGVGPGDAVALYMYNRPEYLYTLFALAKLGAVAVPIDTRLIDEKLTHVLTETDSEIVVLDADTEPEYDAVRNDFGTIGTEFFVGEKPDDRPYNDFDLLLEGEESTAPNVAVAGDDACSVLYVQRYQQPTPQGVVLPHYSYVHTAEKTGRDLLDLGPEDCLFTTLPLYSSYPIQSGIAAALFAGAEFAFEKQFDSELFWDWIRRYDATHFLYLGRMLSVLNNRAESADDADNPAAYALGHGFGFERDRRLIADFEHRFDVTVFEAYGITPTATLGTANRLDDQRFGSVGKPFSHVEVTVVDEDDWEVPTGETGEILVRSTEPNTMFQGFYEDPELTAEVCRNQWIHTNDIGYVDEDGYLHFVASKRNTIHLGRVAGRISSLEIESVIESQPAVKESVVLGVSTGSGGESIKAVVVPHEGASVSPINVNDHCEKQLTHQKLPRYIEVRSELPRTGSGKIRRDGLADTSSADVWDRKSGYDLNR
ncbi:class I adenylate-forming enzyme family protein [Halorientalis marina]|uniref:class I adenylate-forming enzyme family protein n=1 Tax=Halorientalis marina TaxID=2931976 RepID=UPI001FF2DCEC|nr:AMP-binding protein [Halorientalis marina]